MDKVNVGGPKIVYQHILVENDWANIPKDNPGVHYEGPMLEAKTTKVVPPTGGKRQPVVWLTPRRWWH